MIKTPSRPFSPNMNEVPSINNLFRHFKGNFYKIVGFAWHVDFADVPSEQLVLYRPLAEPWVKPWARPIREFYDEVEVDGVWVRRFVKVSASSQTSTTVT